MGTIVDTAIAVGTNAEPFLTSNPGFTAEELAPPFGITHLRVTNTGGVNTVYNNTAEHSYLYLSTATPADRNQSVTIRVKRRTHGGGTYWWAVARFSSGNFVYISFTGDSNKRITIGKRVGGTSTDLGSSEDNARLAADGAEGDLTLEITGTAPTISLRALWNGVQVIAPVTITDAALDAVGRVGFAQRTFAGDSPSTLYHLARFTALDGVGGDTTPPALTSPTGAGGPLSCSGSVSTNDATGTLYAVVTASATAPTGAQVEAGQDHTAAPALRVISQAVSAIGLQSIASGAVSAGTRYLHFMQKDPAGNRSAVVSSAAFTVTAAAPTINTHPSNQTVTAPATTTFSVVATSSGGALTYQWQRQPAGGGGFTNIGSATAASFTPPATSVTGGSANNGDQYRCVVSDSNGSTTSNAATLTVNAPLATLTSQPLRRNSTTLSGATTLSWCAIHNESTGAFVALKTGVTVNSSSVFSVSDAALVAGTEYRLTWREAGGQKGTASVVAA